jgi:RHS repeat-associated protein
MTGETWSNFSTPYQKTYEYDAVGNRTKKISGSGSPVTTDYTYNDNQQLTSTQIAGGGSAGLTNFSYDDNGNMEQSDNNGDVTDYSFNPTGKIASVDFDNGLGYDYQYDSLGNRVQSVEDDGVATPITTDYYFDSLLNGAMSGPVLENVSDNSARFNLRADSGQLVTQAFSSDVTVGVTPFAGAEVNAGLTDGFGNMVELANIDTGVTAWQTNVTAFGESIGQTDPAGVGNQTGFLGRPQLAPQVSGLIDMNARSYDPSLGRFISIDPLQGNATMPQSMNPYSYGLNNPNLWPDPSGLSSILHSLDVMAGPASWAQDKIELGISYVSGSDFECSANPSNYYLVASKQFVNNDTLREYGLTGWEGSAVIPGAYAKKASWAGRNMNKYVQPDPDIRSIAGGVNGKYGRVSKTLLFKGAKYAAKPLPVVGAAATFAMNRCAGDSFTEAAMKTGGAVGGGALGGAATSAICTSGVGTPACLTSGVGLTIGMGEAGEHFGGGLYDLFN